MKEVAADAPRAPDFASCPFEVGRCLPVDAPFAYRVVNWRRCKFNAPSVHGALSATTNNLVSSPVAGFNHHEYETIPRRCCSVRGFRHKHHRAIAISSAIPRQTTCELRPEMGRQDSCARQSRTQRNIVFAEDCRRLASEDTCYLHADTVHLGYVPCAWRLLCVTWLRIRAGRCSRPRKFWRRVRAVHK